MSSKDRIQFALVQNDTPLLDFLMNNFALSSFQANELVELGAIYINQKRLSSSESNNIANSLNQKICLKNDLIRVHLKPKRFPKPNKIEILSENSEFVAVWKPSGLPSHPTLDNQIENMKTSVEEYLHQKIWSLARLDVGTDGILIFAKTSIAAKKWNIDYLPRAQKFYRALVALPILGEKKLLRLGLWQHWMLKSDRSPKIIKDHEFSESQLCELEVLSCSKIGIPNDINIKSINDFDIYELKIRLISGRTHQIRSQLAFEGFPILGDSLYGGLASSDSNESFALTCEKIIIDDWVIQKN